MLDGLIINGEHELGLDFLSSYHFQAKFTKCWIVRPLLRTQLGLDFLCFSHCKAEYARCSPTYRELRLDSRLYHCKAEFTKCCIVHTLIGNVS